jgi:DNA-binding GntR family transcriptional regulator
LILRTELEPGQALVEAELVTATGLGRTPIREALRRLVHEGLVEIRPRRGTFVSQVTIGDLPQIFEVRLGIEGIVAGLAVERCTEDDLDELRDLLDRQRASANDEDAGVALDGELHRLLLRVARNRYLEDIYQRVGDASLRLLYLTRCGMESKTEQADFMATIEAALSGRDAERLASALRDHVQEFRERVGGSIVGKSVRLLRPGPRLEQPPRAATRAGRA